MATPSQLVGQTISHYRILEKLGGRASLIFTFLVNPGSNTPPLIRRLRPADDEHASYVAKEKMKKSNFKSLHLTR